VGTGLWDQICIVFNFKYATNNNNNNNNNNNKHQLLVKTCYFSPLHLSESRDSSVGIALGYGLDDWGSGVRFPAGAGNFSLNHRVQKGSGAHPVSYMGTRGSFPGGTAAGA
jgi:hypothetical protein